MTAPLQFWNELAQGPLGSNWEHMGTHWLRGYAGSNTRLDLLVPEGLWGLFVDPCGNFI